MKNIELATPRRGSRAFACALALLLGLTTTAIARPMTPYENGVNWIWVDCLAEPNTTRSDEDCISQKCDALPGVVLGSQDYWLCVGGATGCLNFPALC